MQHIDIDHEFGSANGYAISSDQIGPRHYLSQYTDLSESIMDFLKEQHESVTLLKNINVDEDHQGEGIGSDLLSDFIGRSEGPILLISDKYESQREGFSLDQWYEGFGFVTVAETGSGSLMAFPEEVGLELKDHLDGLNNDNRPT